MAAPASSVSASATCAAASAPRSRASPRVPVAERDCWRSASTGEVSDRRRAGAIPNATAVAAVAISGKEQHTGVETDVVEPRQRLAPEGLQAREPGRRPRRVRPRRQGTPAGDSRPGAGARAETGPSRARRVPRTRARDRSPGRGRGWPRSRRPRAGRALRRQTPGAAGVARCATSSSCSGIATIALFFAAGQRSCIGRRQRRQFGLGLFQGDAIAQPADGGQRVVLFIGVPGKIVRDPRRHVRGDGILEVGRARSPATSAGLPLSRIVAPTMAGSPPKCVRQVASLSTTRRVPVSSSRSKPRPSWSCERSTLK